MDTYPTWPNLPAMMFGLAQAWPERPMFRAWRDGAWQSIRWGEFGRLVAACARRLLAAGLRPGDRVMIVSENRPEYAVAETALMTIRAVSVPAYVTNTVDDHAHILRDCGARAAIVSTAVLAQRIREAAARAGGLDLMIVLDALPGEAGNGPGVIPRVISWAELVAEADAPADDVARDAAAIPASTLACLIYTSGTGGTPRGVILPHRSILSNCAGAFELLRPMRLRDETYLSYLPAAHSFEHTVGQFFLPSLGTEIVYGRGVEHFAADMLAVRPTILTAVPRVLEVIRTRALGQVARAPAWRRRLFEQAMASGFKRLSGRLGAAERLADPLLDRLVRAKVRARFGGRLKGVMSGGARLDPEVGLFFLAVGLRVMQGYGQTEAG
ncbi:MAG: AMP-binding protein, partial [Pseudomonadota bacterium]|nr:AMP-binding protein [Pseudomonadota bacterium]